MSVGCEFDGGCKASRQVVPCIQPCLAALLELHVYLCYCARIVFSFAQPGCAIIDPYVRAVLVYQDYCCSHVNISKPKIHKKRYSNYSLRSTRLWNGGSTRYHWTLLLYSSVNKLMSLTKRAASLPSMPAMFCKFRTTLRHVVHVQSRDL
jgi:hypothetical protein